MKTKHRGRFSQGNKTFLPRNCIFFDSESVKTTRSGEGTDR